jgi:hypothetical protein
MKHKTIIVRNLRGNVDLTTLELLFARKCSSYAPDYPLAAFNLSATRIRLYDHTKVSNLYHGMHFRSNCS